MVVVGIDPSYTGLALTALEWDGVGKTELLSKKLISTEKTNYDSRPSRLYDLVWYETAKFVDEAFPDLVAIEGYSFGSKNAREQMGELGGLLRFHLYLCGFRYIDVPPSTLKQYVTGKGNSPKNIMIREVFKKWKYETDDDNEADAYSLAQLAIDFLNPAKTKGFEALCSKIEIVYPRGLKVTTGPDKIKKGKK